MSLHSISEIDGRWLYYSFVAGAKNILAQQAYLNKINVFPVNDGDTGSNMASTVRAVIESIHPLKSYKITANHIAETTMINARGNSGIIFAQFLYGMSVEARNISSINIPQFAESVKNSVVIGGNEKTRHIHVHTDNPAVLFQQLNEISLVTFHKADDMKRQFSGRNFTRGTNWGY